MNNINLPPDIEFYQDPGLLVYRPKGLINEPEIDRIIGVIESIEGASQEPFNRLSDTSETHEVELNFKYVIRVSLHRRLFHKGRAPVKSAILATGLYSYSLRSIGDVIDRRFINQSSCVSRPK